MAPCFSTSHSPAPQSFRPVLSTSRCRGSPSLRGRGRGTSSALRPAAQGGVVRHGQNKPEQADDGTDQALGLAQGQVEHGRSVSAVRIVRDEYQGCPPGVVRGSARQPSMASSVNQTVRLPRWRKLASYARQFRSLCFCLGMWWRRCWFSLNGKVGIRGQVRAQPLGSPGSRHHQTDPCNKVTSAYT